MPDRESVGRTLEAIYRIEAPTLIARLARITHDVGLAEELAHDALVVAIERWQADGIPDKPGAWLMTTAKRAAIDAVRRRQRFARVGEQVGHEPGPPPAGGAEAIVDALDDDVGDDLLRLVFTACHPRLADEARVALTLRLVGGLTVEEIARAYLVAPTAIAQRIVRAKRLLADEHIPFEVPHGAELAPRLASVLGVIYLIFNEGYTATAGSAWTRPELCEEAVRLGRILASLRPDDAEVHGLVALMELQASRLAARVGPSGEPILLLDQNRARWDATLIRHGLAALARADSLGPRGPYTLQAAIAAVHARARTADATDWHAIAQRYAELARIAPSPVVELNRAVAVAMADGPAAGLAITDGLGDALAGYHLLASVRGDLLAKLGRYPEAHAELVRAAAMTSNTRERELLLERAAGLRRS